MSARPSRTEALRLAKDNLASIRERADELLRQAPHYDISLEGQARQVLEYAEDLKATACELVANLTVLARY